MSGTRSALLAALLLGTTASVADAAAVLYTPSLMKLVAVDSYLCAATNTGTKTVDVTVEIIDAGDGSVTETLTLSLAPLKALIIFESDPPLDTSMCRVTGLTKKTGTVAFSSFSGPTPVMTVSVP